MNINIGEEVPDFKLYNSEGQPVTLSEQRGQQVVLAFFPFAFTGVCTTEMCTFRDDLSSYQNLGAKVYGISVDAPATQAKFKELNDLNFELLSDFNKEVSEAYGTLSPTWGMELRGVSRRAVFVIDAEGKLKYWEET